MAEPNTGKNSPDMRRNGGSRKPPGRSSEMPPAESSSNSGIPCGACKFLRRRCVNGCIFAPYFSPDQGAALFAAVHKVFGASNVSKLLMHLPVHHRHHAVETISYEAQARLSDPVYGCVSTVIALQKQVVDLRMELAMVQNQLLNNRLTVANTLHGSLQQLQPLSGSSQHNLAIGNRCSVPSQSSIDPLQFCQEIGEENGDPLAFAEQMLRPI